MRKGIGYNKLKGGTRKWMKKRFYNHFHSNMQKVKSIFNKGIFFWIFMVLYLITREWPYGGKLQTILDVLVIIVIILSIIGTILTRKEQNDESV